MQVEEAHGLGKGLLILNSYHYDVATNFLSLSLTSQAKLVGMKSQAAAQCTLPLYRALIILIGQCMCRQVLAYEHESTHPCSLLISGFSQGLCLCMACNEPI